MRDRMKYAPAMTLAFGCLLMLSVQAQRSMALQAPLSQLPDPVAGYERADYVIPEDEARVAGMTAYTSRIYKQDSAEVMGLYVGFYESQRQGKAVHSPKNCLPGGGWEAMTADRVTLAIPGRPDAELNRYMIANQNQRAIVYYWYQGRGRVAANEYAVKWHLMRDAAIRRRTDEALVRLVIPITPTMSAEDADQLAERTARQLIPSLDQFLPA
jgi:EpsI family protein